MRAQKSPPPTQTLRGRSANRQESSTEIGAGRGGAGTKAETQSAPQESPRSKGLNAKGQRAHQDASPPSETDWRRNERDVRTEGCIQGRRPIRPKSDRKSYAPKVSHAAGYAHSNALPAPSSKWYFTMPMSAPLNAPPFSVMETLLPAPTIRKHCLLSAVGARSAACTPSANHCGAGPSYELTSAAVLLLCATPGVTPKPTATMPMTFFPGTACSTFCG